ncbi:MAG: GntR family transcriptional regulator [Anaerolineales bacterium]|nr:GntR family transcriptional regulator [Anaerolineales bacterium]
MADFSRLDRTSGLPLYIQLKQNLIFAIEHGEWQPGEQLPGEPELCRLYQVSRTVVRQALKEMSYEGRILRMKGKGTFVAEPRASSRSLVHSLTGFFEDMERRGQAPVDRFLERELIPADTKIASYLELQELDPVYKITRLRFISDEPMVLVTSYLPYEKCRKIVEEDLSNRSLYAFLRDCCGLTIARGRRRIDVIVADEVEAEYFQVQRGFPLLRMESVSYSAAGEPIEYFNGLFRTDRASFVVDLVNVPADNGFVSESDSGEGFWLP